MDESKVVAVKVYWGYNESGERAAKCDVRYANGEIVRNVMWDTFPLDADVVVHDMRAVNRFEN